MLPDHPNHPDRDVALTGLLTQLRQACQTATSIAVQAAQEGNHLYILLEASPAPTLQFSLDLITSILHRLDRQQFPNITIYGRTAGDPFVTWHHRFEPVAKTPQPSFKVHPPTGDSIEPSNLRVEKMIVCGLGTLGQHCVLALQQFARDELEIQITGIDRQPPQDWEFDDFVNQLDTPIVQGDCRRDPILEQAGIRDCQAILIVTHDDSTNIETAIAARRLNPTVNIVIKSSQKNLNELLKNQLGNFVALEPIELPASTLSLAALGEKILGIFNLKPFRFKIIKHTVRDNQDIFYGLALDRLYYHRKTQRLLDYRPSQTPTHPAKKPSRVFYQWQPEQTIQIGDEIIYIEASELSPKNPVTARSRQFNLRRFKQQWQKALSYKAWIQKFQMLWQWINANRTRTIIASGLSIGFILGTIGTISLKLSGAVETWPTALSVSVILLLGGYGDVFGGLVAPNVPGWLQLLCFAITAFSLLFVLSVLGLAADSLLNSKFAFLKRRLPIPNDNHVVIIGFGRVAQRVAAFLQELKQPFVLIANQEEAQSSLLQASIVYSNISQGLKTVNLDRAKSVVLATDNQLLNLEAALMSKDVASRANHHLELIVRTNNQLFNQQVQSLLPDARAFCIYALSAEAFVGAAFGENIISLFRMRNTTVLVTEFVITATDTMHGKLLADISYGYGVVTISHRPAQTLPGQEDALQLMPPDDTLLQVGDRLVLLATINGLRRIEQGDLAPRQRWQLQARKPLDSRSMHYAGDALTNVTGCPLSVSRHFMQTLPNALNLPGIMELELYEHQAHALYQKLHKLLPINLVLLDN